MTPNIVRMWYNVRDNRLHKAVKKLSILNKQRLRLKGSYLPWRVLWLGIVCTLRRWHLNRLRRDHYGAAIMWEPDPEWLALQSALQVRGIILMQFIDDVRLEADLTEYLMASRHVRLRLRSYKRRPRPSHPDMIELDRFAGNFADRMSATLRNNAH